MTVTPDRYGNYYQRAAYRALNARPASVIAAEKAAAAAKAMTCQICGRQIFAQSGYIAHHGYQRPGDGWQTASCEGAKKLPFEVSCAELQAHVNYHQERLERMRQALAEAEAEPQPIELAFRVVDRGPLVRVTVTPETFDAVKAENAAVFRMHSWYSYTPIREHDLHKRRSAIKQLADYLEMQRGRLQGWKQTHRAGSGGETVWVVL